MAVANDDLIAGAEEKPCGYARYTVNTAVQNLEAAPTAGKSLAQCKGKPMKALIQVTGQDVRWTDDPDVDPSATVGMLWKVDVLYEYKGDLSMLRWIEAVASAVVNVSYRGGM